MAATCESCGMAGELYAATVMLLCGSSPSCFLRSALSGLVLSQPFGLLSKPFSRLCSFRAVVRFKPLYKCRSRVLLLHCRQHSTIEARLWIQSLLLCLPSDLIPRCASCLRYAHFILRAINAGFVASSISLQPVGMPSIHLTLPSDHVYGGRAHASPLTAGCPPRGSWGVAA